jgi:hypothetical protein
MAQGVRRENMGDGFIPETVSYDPQTVCINQPSPKAHSFTLRQTAVFSIVLTVFRH